MVSFVLTNRDRNLHIDFAGIFMMRKREGKFFALTERECVKRRKG